MIYKLIFVTTAVLACLMPASVDAEVVIDVSQFGNSLTASVSGDADVGLLNTSSEGPLTVSFGSLSSSSEAVIFTAGKVTGNRYDRFVLPASAGPTVIGDFFRFTNTNVSPDPLFGGAGLIHDPSGGFDGFNLLLPVGYTGGQLSGNSTFEGVSLADLGVSSGDEFTWRWATSSGSDSLRLQFGVTSIPEPSTTFGVSIVGLFVLVRSRFRNGSK